VWAFVNSQAAIETMEEKKQWKIRDRKEEKAK